MSETGTLACLECGEPIPGGNRWLCGAQCTAVMNLVRYGRRSESDDLSPIEDDRLRRYRREADIEGPFPTQRVRDAVLTRDDHRCLLCGAGGADEVDYQSDEPSLERKPRGKDLRTLCSKHHQSESRRRFVDDRGRIAPTAPATWARIEAAEPLVPRDDSKLWDDGKNLRLLSAWPLMRPATRIDLERWVQSLGEGTPEAQGDPGGDQPDPMDPLNAALDRLGLPLRRQERLVRAIHALVLAAHIDRDSLQVVPEARTGGDAQPVAPDAGRAR